MQPTRAQRNKRAKTSTDGDAATVQRPRRALRGKKGGLANMPSMPIDILVEIFGHLLPSDLLNLARTTKAFRALIMKRESSFIWKSARHNVPGLPDCPPYLSEPAFANLAFNTDCHACSKKNTTHILWHFRARLCTKCRNDWRRFTNTLPKCPLPNTDMRELVPAESYKYQTKEVEEVYEKICAVSGKPEASKYIEERKALVHQIDEHAKLCRVWAENRARSRAQELEDIRRCRLNDILDRLQAAGWEKEIECMEDNGFQKLQANAQVRLSKPLTDRAWLKMQDEVIEIVREVRQRRLRNEQKARLQRRLPVLLKFVAKYIKSTYPSAEADYMPRPVDVASFPEFRELMLAPESGEITNDSFQPLLPRLPSMVEQWKAGIKAQLSAMVTKYVNVPDDVDPLSLAVACFKCQWCSRNDLRYPAMLAHVCLRKEYAYTVSDDYDWIARQASGMGRWSAAPVQCVSSYVKAVVEACGKPVERTTAEELDALDLRFRGRLTHIPERRTIASWRAAYSSMPHFVVVVADDEEREAVRPIEERQSDARRRSAIWCCALCKGPGAHRTDSVEVIKRHLKKEHSVRDASVETGEIYLHPDGEKHNENEIYLYSYELTEEKLRAWDRERFTRGQACFFHFSSPESPAKTEN